MNCRAGAGAGASSASIGRTSFRQVGNDICSICGSHSFAPLRVCVCLYLLRSTSGDSLQTIVLFFGRATGQQDNRTTTSTASHLLLLFQACRKCLLFCPSPVAPISWPGQVSFFVLLREFITFRVLRLLSGSSAPSPSLVLLLCSAFFSSFLLLFI